VEKSGGNENEKRKKSREGMEITGDVEKKQTNK